MALLVEDGSGIAGANSYVSVVELRAFAGDRGVILPAQDSDVEPLLVLGCDFLELKSYIGERFSDEQGLSWPRTDLYDPEWAYPNTIPANLKKAQRLLSIEAMNGPLSTATRPGDYIQTKIDVLYIKYATDANRAAGLNYRAIDDLIRDIVATYKMFETVRA